MNVTLLTATFTDLMNDTSYTITVTPYNRVVAGMSTAVIITTSLSVLIQSNNNESNNESTYSRVQNKFNILECNYSIITDCSTNCTLATVYLQSYTDNLANQVISKFLLIIYVVS